MESVSRVTWGSMARNWNEGAQLNSTLKSIYNTLSSTNLDVGEALSALQTARSISGSGTFSHISSSIQNQSGLSSLSSAASTALTSIQSSLGASFYISTDNKSGPQTYGGPYAPPFNNSITMKTSSGAAISAANIDNDITPFSVSYYPSSNYTAPLGISASFLTSADRSMILAAMQANVSATLTTSSGATVQIHPGTVTSSGPSQNISPGSISFGGPASAFIGSSAVSGNLGPVLSQLALLI